MRDEVKKDRKLVSVYTDDAIKIERYGFAGRSIADMLHVLIERYDSEIDMSGGE